MFLVFIPVITILLALFFAFMVNAGGRGGAGGVKGVRGSGVYKIVYFFPQVLSLAILAVLFGAVYRSDEGGLLNGLLVKAGLVDAASPIEWLNEPDLVLWCLMAVVVWHGVGFYLVLFSAAMQSIPRDIYEAALLDGAGRAQTFFRVTLPLLWDSVQTSWVYLGITVMDLFVLVSTMTSGQFGGGPDHHSEVMATVLMRNFLYFGNSGYACAMGVVMLCADLDPFRRHAARHPPRAHRVLSRGRAMTTPTKEPASTGQVPRQRAGGRSVAARRPRQRGHHPQSLLPRLPGPVGHDDRAAAALARTELVQDGRTDRRISPQLAE